MNPEIFWTQCGCGNTVAIISASYFHFLPKIDMKCVSFFLGTGARVAKMSDMEGSKTAPTLDQTKQTTMWIQKYFEPNVAAATRWPLLARATFISCPKLTWSVSVSSLGLGLGLQKCQTWRAAKLPIPRSNETNINVNPEIFWTQCGCGDTVAIISASYLHFLPKIDMKRVSFFLGTGARVAKMSDIFCFNFFEIL